MSSSVAFSGRLTVWETAPDRNGWAAVPAGWVISGCCGKCNRSRTVASASVARPSPRKPTSRKAVIRRKPRAAFVCATHSPRPPESRRFAMGIWRPSSSPSAPISTRCGSRCWQVATELHRRGCGRAAAGVRGAGILVREADDWGRVSLKPPGFRCSRADGRDVHPPYFFRWRKRSMPSTSASQLASMMLSETPTVPQVVSPSVETMSTRVLAAVASWPSRMRTL